MNKKSKLLQQRNERVQKRFSEELARTPNKKTMRAYLWSLELAEYDANKG